MPRDSNQPGHQFRPQCPYPDADRITWSPLFPPDPIAPSNDHRLTSERPKWIIIPLLLFLIALGIAIAFFREISGFLGQIGKLGDHPSEKELFKGFVAFGLILVFVIAIVKVALQGPRNRN